MLTIKDHQHCELQTQPTSSTENNTTTESEAPLSVRQYLKCNEGLPLSNDIQTKELKEVSKACSTYDISDLATGKNIETVEVILSDLSGIELEETTTNIAQTVNM